MKLKMQAPTYFYIKQVHTGLWGSIRLFSSWVGLQTFKSWPGHDLDAGRLFAWMNYIGLGAISWKWTLNEIYIRAWIDILKAKKL